MKKEFPDPAIEKLNARYAKLQNRLDQIYLDKRDGEIEEALYRKYVARNAAEFYRTHGQPERAALLKSILQGSALQDGKIVPVFKPLFDIIHTMAEEVAPKQSRRPTTPPQKPPPLKRPPRPRRRMPAQRPALHRGDRVLAADVIDLPQAPSMLTAGELEVLYISHRPTTRQIATMTRPSHNTIIEHMKRHGIVRSRKRRGIPRLSALLVALVG